MAIEVPQNEEISGVGKNRGRGANMGSYTLRKESKEELLREMLIST